MSVALAPLGPRHAAAMLAWMADPAVRDNVGLRVEPTAARTADWIARAQADPTVAAFAILEDGRHVGNVVLDRIAAGAARLSIYLGDAADRGRGLGRQALRLALAEAFGPLALDRVWLTARADHAPALAAYAAAGFAREEFLPGGFAWRGGTADAVRLGISAAAFRAAAPFRAAGPSAA